MKMNETKYDLYNVEPKMYNLDPTKIMDVVSDLAYYAKIFKEEALSFGSYLTPFILAGKGRRLLVKCNEMRLDYPVIKSCSLAELVLSEDGQRLDLEVNQAQNVTVNPKFLHEIGEKYSR